LIDLLIEIPGPQFIFLFIIYSALCIFIGRHANGNDSSKDFPLPPITAFDGYTIAVLRGGWKAVLESAVYGLWKKEILDFKPTSHFWKGSGIEAVRKSERNASFNAMEKIVYDYFHKKRNLQEIFEDENVKITIDSKIQPAIQRLQAGRLLKTSNENKRSYLILAVTLIAIYSIGLIKLYYGLMRDRPVGFLAIILLCIPIIVSLFLKPKRPQTVLGISYLDTLKDKFDWMKEKARSEDLSSIDPVHVAAIYGVAAITANSAIATSMNRYTNYNSGGCSGAGCGGGGCGGGCGGCGGCGG
jgi:uncharacterized protein (TIGR04222 family)